MTTDDISNIREMAETVIEQWSLIQSTSSLPEVNAYQNTLDDAMVPVESMEQWADEQVRHAQNLRDEAKKLKRNLKTRQEQAKRLFWSLRDGEKKLPPPNYAE